MTRETGNGKREMANGKRETENGKREMANGKRETENGKRETENGKRETENGKRETENRKRSGGFSLLELLAVIVILGMLAGLGAPMIISAQRQARQADCRSNLRQFGIALAAYRSDHNGLNPPWMSNLFPEYIDGKDVFVCKSDRDYKNTSSYCPIPKVIYKGKGNKVKEIRPKPFTEVSDFGNSTQDGRNSDIKYNSYFYEFSAAKCSWDSNTAHDADGNGTVAWWEAKEWQLRYGDDANGGGDPSNPKPYSTARMPIIRCWHHWNEGRTPGYEQENGKRGAYNAYLPLIINVGYAGNVFASPHWWEGRPDVGER